MLFGKIYIKSGANIESNIFNIDAGTAPSSGTICDEFSKQL